MSKKPESNLLKQLFNRQLDTNIYQFQPNLYRERLHLARNLYRTDLIAHYGCVNAIEFSNGGKYLVSGGDDKRVLIWDLEKSMAGDSPPIHMDRNHQSNIFCLAFDQSNRKIYSGGNDEMVLVHDFQTRKVSDVYLHQKPVYGVSVDPTSHGIFATACEDGKITIFDQRRGAAIQSFGKLGSRQTSFHAVQFHPYDGNFIVTANTKKGAAFWDLRIPSRPVISYGGDDNQQSCMSVRFSTNGNLVLALRRRLPPILYNTFTEKPICQLYHPDYYNSCTMKSCCFAGGDDEYILSGSDDFNLYVWKVGDINLELTNQWIESTHMILYGHRSIVNQVRFNPEKCLIASSGVEKVIKLWSPFNQKGWSGSLIDEQAGPENPREVFTHDAYVSLVNTNMSHDYSTQNTQEDSRMMAFFDSLIQQEIEGWNTNYISDSDINTDPSSGQSTRRNSSTEDSDDNDRNRATTSNQTKPQRNKYTNRIAYLIATKRNTLRRLALKGASNTSRRRRQNSLKTKRKTMSLPSLRSGSGAGGGSSVMGTSRSTRNGNSKSKRTNRFAASLAYRNRLLIPSTTRGEVETHALKIARHKRYDALFKSMRRKHRNRRYRGGTQSTSEDDNDIKFNYETVRTTNLAIPSTSTGITSSGSDIIIRLRQQEQLLDSDSDDDDDDLYNPCQSNANQSTPTVRELSYDFSRVDNSPDRENDDASTSSSMVVNTSIDDDENDDDTQRPPPITSDSNDDNLEDENSRSNNSQPRPLTTTKVTISTTTKVNRKRCHAINFDIFSSHPSSRVANTYLEDDPSTVTDESLDCFLTKKIKKNNVSGGNNNASTSNDTLNNNNNNKNTNGRSLVIEDICTPIGRDANHSNNDNANYFNTPDSGISMSAGGSSTGCSSSRVPPATNNNLNSPDNDAIESVDRISITLFHENVSRVRRNYRKKFEDDSDSD